MRPLTGVRIADFTIHAAGPFATHMLAQMGAECIKIESAARPDIFRKPHAVYGRLEPATFDQVSSGKLSVRLNLKHPLGRDLALRLVGVSDVAAESFRPGVMRRLGLAYEDLSAVKPDLVMLSVSSSGQTGTDSHFAGYAPLFGAWGGLGYLTGHPDGPPVEMRHVMDHSVGLNAAMATLAALLRRRRTGNGSYVDVAAREVAASLVGDALLEAAAGLSPERCGNTSPDMSPHGVYPTCSDDAWVSVAVAHHSQWLALVEVIGRGLPPVLSVSMTAAQRLLHRHEVDTYLTSWTRERSADEVAQRLQAAGVPAHPSWSAADIVADDHLRQRRAVVEAPVRGGTSRAAVGFPAVFSSTDDIGIWRGTPVLGEDEEYVFGELLGLSRRQRDELTDDGVIT